jgi:hypothetical protein
MGRNLRKIIEDQKAELARLQAQDMLDRVPMKTVDVFSHLAQAVIGMRRSGKSVVCRKAMNDSGVVYGHDHCFWESAPATTRDSICVCAKWHDWKPLTLVKAFRIMDEA